MLFAPGLGLILLLTLAATAPALAAYRCGNVFQDRPCTNGQNEVQILPSGRRVESTPGSGMAEPPAQPAARATQPAAAASARTVASAATAPQGMVKTTTPVAPATTAAAAPAAAAPAASPTSSSADEAKKKAQCASLRSQGDGIAARLRAGGSAAVMENYQQQRRYIDQQLSQLRC